jgi:hypothetical protein
MKTLLLLAALLLNSPLVLASVPVDNDEIADCKKEKSQTTRSADAPTARTTTAPSTTTPRARGGSLNGSRSATQRWNSFLPGMIR